MLEAFSVFTPVSFYSFGGVLALLLIAYVAAKAVLPSNATKTDKVTFVWLVSINIPLCNAGYSC